MTRLVIAQHQADAPPGVLGDWAAATGLETDVVRADVAGRLPGPEEADVVAVLGSDEEAVLGRRSWIDREARWIERLARARVPVLGVCFGAQLLAVALGGGRRRAPRPEVAWIEVRTEDEQRVPPGPWFAWHADVIVPPPGATVIARNRTGVQAYALGPHLGVQFHPEVTPEIINAWAGKDGRALSRLGLARRTLAHQCADRAEASGAAARQLFDAFLLGAAGRTALIPSLGGPAT